MTSSTLSCPVVHCNSGDDWRRMSQKFECDENGNLSLKLHDLKANNPNSDHKPLKNYAISMISGLIEAMYEYFPSECLVYVRKLLPSRNFTSELSLCDHIGILLNVFIRCIKCCLESTNCDFNILSNLRGSIVSMLTFLSNFEELDVLSENEKKLINHKACVIFGYLFDVELLSSCYRSEKFEIIKNRLLKYMDCFLGSGDDRSIAVLYSKEFLSTNICQNYEDIRVPILETLLKVNSSGILKILLFKLWKNFSKDPEKERDFIKDIISKKILPQDLVGLEEFLSVVPKQLENDLAEFLLNSEFNVPRTIEMLITTREASLEIDFSVPEVDFVDAPLIPDEKQEYEDTIEEESPKSPSEESNSKLPLIEHDYCRFTSSEEEVASVSLGSEPSEDGTSKDGSDQHLPQDESVEVELCDLCVELGTLAIDSSISEMSPRSLEPLNISSNLNGENGRGSVDESLLYLADPIYQLHCDTCEADGKCFARQYDYIIFCKQNTDPVPTELSEVTFSEESRCQCLSCQNNFECLLKNWRMLKEYTRERTERIKELEATNAKLVENEVANDRVHTRVPPEYKRSASETLKHKLPLKKRKFSFDES